jgi:hypothetical protein
MHPAGIKFGLEHNLLEFRRADVVVADRFFEALSTAARRRIQHNNRLAGTDLWDQVVSAGLRKVFYSTTARHTEVVPFFTGLDRVIHTTLIPLAERAKVGKRMGRDILLQDSFWTEFNARVKKLALTRDMVQSRRLCFRACCNAVKALCTVNDPGNLKHADLLGICAYTLLDAAGCIEITVFFQTVKPRRPL